MQEEPKYWSKGQAGCIFSPLLDEWELHPQVKWVLPESRKKGTWRAWVVAEPLHLAMVFCGGYEEGLENSGQD